MSQLLTAEEVTNLYLYGQKTKPADMTSDSLIRNSDDKIPPVKINIDAYMAGPGRFATPDKFEIVKKFLNPLTDFSSFRLAPGTYSKDDLYTAFGITTSDSDFLRKIVKIDQKQYDDGKDDFLERAYIWGNTAFKISDGTSFVVEPDGKRYIKDYAVVPYLNEGAKKNFDLVGGDSFTDVANNVLGPKIDPSNIGRKVEFDFSTDRAVQKVAQEAARERQGNGKRSGAIK